MISMTHLYSWIVVYWLGKFWWQMGLGRKYWSLYWKRYHILNISWIMWYFVEAEGVFKWKQLRQLRTITRKHFHHLTTDGLEKYSMISMTHCSGRIFFYWLGKFWATNNFGYVVWVSLWKKVSDIKYLPPNVLISSDRRIYLMESISNY